MTLGSVSASAIELRAKPSSATSARLSLSTGRFFFLFILLNKLFFILLFILNETDFILNIRVKVVCLGIKCLQT